MTLDTFINDICAMEGKKVEVSRGNVKEIAAAIFTRIAAQRILEKTDFSEVDALIERQVKSKMKKVKNV